MAPPATDPATELPGERLERDLSEIEHLANVGPARYGANETLQRLRSRVRDALERYAQAGGEQPTPGRRTTEPRQ